MFDSGQIWDLLTHQERNEYVRLLVDGGPEDQIRMQELEDLALSRYDGEEDIVA